MPRTNLSAHARTLFVLAALLLFCAQAAQAAPQTFVSAKGDDANPCAHASPCRTFAGALAKTDFGGELAVLDSGEYGPVTINYSVKITAVGVFAGITAFDADAVTVKPSSGAVVALRGLTLTGQGGAHGIYYDGPGAARAGDPKEPSATLHVENCTISGFTVNGIYFYGNGSLLVKDTTVRNNDVYAIELTAPADEKVRAAIVNSRLEGNHAGLFAHSDDLIEVTVRDTVAANNQGTGFAATSEGVRMQLQNCVSANQHAGVSAAQGARVTVEGCALTNSKYGIYVTKEGVARVSGTTVTDNEVGVANLDFNGVVTYGHVYTFGNNRVFGNKQETEGKPSLIVKQF
ncbi:MAG TPA: right-handed parallel beta-helix repeat-containing protein [Pyrinomonadaceae bacterium]|nr:right-handed parallel beta-helix repeat-containing protein [Pyrinomonadaceae bacterium]